MTRGRCAIILLIALGSIAAGAAGGVVRVDNWESYRPGALDLKGAWRPYPGEQAFKHAPQIVRDGQRIAGVAVRTPPYNLVLARPVDDRAVDALVESISSDLPGVVGAVPEVDAFTEAWTSRHDVTAIVRFEQRVYALERLVPARPTDGRFRLAGADDRELAIEWTRDFAAEALHDDDRYAGRVERSVDARLDRASPGGIGLWEIDDGPVSLPPSAARRRTGCASGLSTRLPSTAAAATAPR